MKLVGFLVIAFSLVVGVVGAVTAYSPSLSLPDRHLVGLALAGPAGATADADGQSQPIAAKGATLTPELLAALRNAGVQRVRLKEFSLARWSEGWMFGLGCVGLVLGGVVVRRQSRKRVTAAAGAGEQGRETPQDALQAVRAEVDRLRHELPGIRSTEGQLEAILRCLGQAQRTHLAAFVAAKPLLVAKMGLAGYARLMDHFAAAERQINRAWSAAADGVAAEALECLDRTPQLLDETAKHLPL